MTTLAEIFRNNNNSTKSRRLLFGIFLLLVVNVLWVTSAEISRWLFKDQNYSNAYLTTYLKTSLFLVYLLGFLFNRSWRDQCLKKQIFDQETTTTTSNKNLRLKLLLEHAEDDGGQFCELEDEETRKLSSPSYEPLRKNSDSSSERSSLASLCNELNETNSENPIKKPRLVRFNKIKEIRRMPQLEADAALLARLPHDAWLKVVRIVARQYNYKLPVRKIWRLALQFTFVWFLGNYAYHEALKYTEAGVVSVLSVTSSFFTLLLAGVLPATPNDKMTLSKVCLVFISLFGVCTVTYADKGNLELGVPKGAIWALVGSLSYSIYLVLLRRSVESEDQLDIPMFFGFVGLFNVIFLWPGLYLLHATNLEPFYPLPDKTQLLYMIVNGLLGTVLSEYLWLCGCFLTSSLTATLSLSLSIPMTILVDCILRRTNYSLIFYFGSLPILFSVVTSSLLLNYDNYDPIYAIFSKVCRIFRPNFKNAAAAVVVRSPRVFDENLKINEESQSLIEQ